MKKVNKENLYIFLVFLAIDIVVIAFHFLFHPVRILGMDKSLFYLDEQITLAVFLSISINFLVGFLSFQNLKYIKKKSQKILTTIFSTFFIVLALDEYLEIHEKLNGAVKDSVKEGLISTLANLSWIFPLSIIIVIVFAMFITMLIKEKNKFIRLPLLFGLLSFALVLIFEVIGSATYGQSIYVAFVGVEEGLEMIGSTLFLFAVLNKRTELES